jgi:hypothetical protein
LADALAHAALGAFFETTGEADKSVFGRHGRFQQRRLFEAPSP